MQNEKPKAYIVKMSGLNVKIDQDEVNSVVEGIMSGRPIKVRQGIINPSYYIGIVEDHERIKSYMDEINNVIAGNENYKKYQIGEKKSLPEFKKLSDIFEGLSLPAGRKQLR